MNDLALQALARSLGLPVPFAPVSHYRQVANAIADRRRETGRPLLAAICGPQGSGKSTMAAFVQAMLAGQGLATALLSLDDLYLDPEDRPVDVHPLFATRGVPGTHDVTLGNVTIDRLFAAQQGECTAIPRFDKATDRRRPPAEWDRFTGGADVILLEGWCVGALPQGEAALVAPVNRLEAEEDGDGVWRRHVNAVLGGEYRALFDRIGFQAYLAAPSFDCVLAWRTRQEERLRARVGASQPGLMDAPALARFVMHYERISRNLAVIMPDLADFRLDLGEDQAVVATRQQKRLHRQQID